MSQEPATTDANAPWLFWDFACENTHLRPDELFAYATLHDKAGTNLLTQADLDRVAEGYIRHCRKVGYWAFMNSEDPCPYHKIGEGGYRDRLKGYKATLAWWLRKTKAEKLANIPPKSKYEIKFAKCRQNRNLKPYGIFENLGGGRSRFISDHATQPEAIAALQKLLTVTLAKMKKAA
jgi:hypothetical protein